MQVKASQPWLQSPSLAPLFPFVNNYLVLAFVIAVFLEKCGDGLLVHSIEPQAVRVIGC